MNTQSLEVKVDELTIMHVLGNIGTIHQEIPLLTR
jgi:hypothetical protein